jgi:hypothetical protein
MNNIFEELLDLILNKRFDVIGEGVPNIYYIGIGRTGSTSILKSFKKETTARWHSVNYFEICNNSYLLSTNNLNLYHLIQYIGKKYNFKPLIIECIRDPISRIISVCGFKLANLPNSNDPYWIPELDKYIKEIKSQKIYDVPEDLNIFTPQSLGWKDVFGVNLIEEFDKNQKYFYKETNEVKLLFLRFEDIKDRKEIFSSIGYNYDDTEKYLDSQKIKFSEFYNCILNNIKFDDRELNNFYDNEIIRTFYSDIEIDGFKQKWRKNES